MFCFSMDLNFDSLILMHVIRFLNFTIFYQLAITIYNFGVCTLIIKGFSASYHCRHSHLNNLICASFSVKYHVIINYILHNKHFLSKLLLMSVKIVNKIQKVGVIIENLFKVLLFDMNSLQKHIRRMLLDAKTILREKQNLCIKF